MKILLQNKSSEEIYKLLKLQENSVYLVKAKSSEDNVEHITFLHTGFKIGSYNMFYSNNYERPYKLQEFYQLEIIKHLFTK